MATSPRPSHRRPLAAVRAQRSRAALQIGPEHHGRRMSLARFAHADIVWGYRYELEHGVVVVVDVPGIPHERVIRELGYLLESYARTNPDRINLVAEAGGCVLRLEALQSERHPDIAVYLSPPPSDDPQAWDIWTPDIVVEVVSRSSRRREYQTKRKDYLAAGVRQYWIIDPERRSAMILSRKGDVWAESKLGPDGVLQSGLLPGFTVKLSRVFSAAKTR